MEQAFEALVSKVEKKSNDVIVTADGYIFGTTVVFKAQNALTGIRIDDKVVVTVKYKEDDE